MKNAEFLKPIIISVVLTPLALYVSYVSIVSRQDYFWAKVFFPYTMLSKPLLGALYVPALLLAVVQFPFYGVILAFAGERKKLGTVAIWLVVVHGLATALCLMAD
ncbi:MAG: hypothetical protein ICV68_10140, partial [Pyrinomonadaceae bacterium]|nr:hypothetical protein [Pyrinomonadaceae bacterium]